VCQDLTHSTGRTSYEGCRGSCLRTHSKDEKTEVLRGQHTCPMSHHQTGKEPRLKPQSISLQSLLASWQHSQGGGESQGSGSG
jgi:hypothetical protein